MRVEWFGQAAFRLEGSGRSVFIDPFHDMSGLESRGMKFDYPAIETDPVDLLLVTHEHGDHNGVDAIPGEAEVFRSTAGTRETSLGQVVGIASEHDDAAGTQRGPNTIFKFELDGVRVCHFGDFGQSALRDEQKQAIGEVDLLFLPVGGGPTIGAEQAHAIANELGASWVVPMHYRTERVSFLEPVDEFLEASRDARRVESPSFDPAELQARDGLVVVPAVP